MANSIDHLQGADPDRGRVAVVTVLEPLADSSIDHVSGAVEVKTVPAGYIENWKNPAFPSAEMDPVTTHTNYLRDFLSQTSGKIGGDGGVRGKSAGKDGCKKSETDMKKNRKPYFRDVRWIFRISGR